MGKFSNFIRDPGTAGPPTREGIRALGFALLSDFPTQLSKFLRVDQAQAFTGPEKAQGRTNLGVVIGTDVQAYDAALASLAALTTAANKMVYTTAPDVYAATDLTPFARTLLDDADAAAFKTTLGLQNVTNTSDANKPVSTAQQAALDLKANLASPALTGSPTAPTQTAGDNSTKIATTAYSDAAVPAFGAALLSLSGGNLVLTRKNGKTVPINGANQIIPAAGVSLAPTGATPLQLNYIYAFMNAGVMTLERSTTAYSIDANTGIAIKTGDPTRTLVGMAQADTGPVWVDSPSKRWVRSWFNDFGVRLFANFTANRTTTSTTYVELNSEIRCQALLWAGEVFEATGAGSAGNNASIQRNLTSLGFDGATPEPNGTLSILNAANDTTAYCCQGLKTGLSEGSHYVTLLGQVNGNTGTWYGDADGRRGSIMARAGR